MTFKTNFSTQKIRGYTLRMFLKLNFDLKCPYIAYIYN